MPSLLTKRRKSKSTSKSSITYEEATSQSPPSTQGSSSRPTAPAPASYSGDRPPPTHQNPSFTTPIARSMSGRRNGQHLAPQYASPSPNSTPKMVNTIRTVPSFDTPSDSSSDSPRNSGFSSSVNSNASGISMSSNQDRSPNARQKQDLNGANGDRTIRAGDLSTKRSDGAMAQEPDEDSGMGGLASPEAGAQGWDSTIGKAGLGKTGRVINKLVSDNDSLKRDIRIERLRAEEAKQAAKLVEDKMERLVNDYESRLLEANVTKTLLARKERQVETLQATVEQEKKRAASAVERESSWRDEMEKMRRSTTREVDEAATHAALMEGRYNAISSHWKDQGDEVAKAHLKLRDEIATLVAERREDDEKITTLQDLCDQQDGNIRELKRQRDEIQVKFDEYKRQQEEMLAGIKASAAGRESEQQQILDESREVLHKLKWALNVKENVEGAG